MSPDLRRTVQSIFIGRVDVWTITESGQGGIRTHDAGNPAYGISSAAPSAARTPVPGNVESGNVENGNAGEVRQISMFHFRRFHISPCGIVYRHEPPGQAAGRAESEANPECPSHTRSICRLPSILAGGTRSSDIADRRRQSPVDWPSRPSISILTLHSFDGSARAGARGCRRGRGRVSRPAIRPRPL